MYCLKSRDPSVTEKYIGYTTQYHAMISHWYDSNLKQPPYMKFINDHGGIDEWDIQILKTCESREEAKLEKSLHLFSTPDEYALNTNGFYKPPKRRYFHRKKKSSEVTMVT